MSYATIAQADAVLTDPSWTNLTDSEKQYALDIGTLWIDENYICTATDPVQDNLVQANILLADKYANNLLFVPNEGIVSKKTSKADVVEVSKEYETGSTSSKDEFAEIKLLLNSVCDINYIQTFKTMRA